VINSCFQIGVAGRVNEVAARPCVGQRTQADAERYVRGCIWTISLLLLPVFTAFAADRAGAVVVYRTTQVDGFSFSSTQQTQLTNSLQSGDIVQATALFNSIVGRSEVSLNVPPAVGAMITFLGGLSEPSDHRVPGNQSGAVLVRAPAGELAPIPKQGAAAGSAANPTASSTDFVSGASTLTSNGAVPYVTAPGVVGQDAGVNYNPAGSVLKLGMGLNQFEIRPKNTESYGVMSVRSSTPNTATGWDIFPNNDPNQGAWIDICNDDLIANPSASWRCLVLYATPGAYFIGVHHLNWTTTPSKPLYIGGQWIEFRANGPFWGHSMGRLEDGAFTLFDATNDLPYFGVKKSLGRMRLMNGMQLAWSGTDSVYTTTDTGLTRSAAGVVRATNGSTGYGRVDALGYMAGGAPGINRTCAGPPTSMTVTSGIITAITCQ